jgi:hypothetical protein
MKVAPQKHSRRESQATDMTKNTEKDKEAERVPEARWNEHTGRKKPP